MGKIMAWGPPLGCYRARCGCSGIKKDSVRLANTALFG